MGKCLICGKDTKNIKYCSRYCVNKSKVKGLKFNLCNNCFELTTNHKYCSSNCFGYKNMKNSKHSLDRLKNISIGVKNRYNMDPNYKIKQSISHKKPLTQKHIDSLIEVWKNNDFISNTEKALCSALVDEKITFINQYRIYGIPDIFIEPNICVFVDGDYWHGNTNLERIGILSDKQLKRKNKDIYVNKWLMNNGYVVLRFWETDINNNIELCINKIKSIINSQVIEVLNG